MIFGYLREGYWYLDCEKCCYKWGVFYLGIVGGSFVCVFDDYNGFVDWIFRWFKCVFFLVDFVLFVYGIDGGNCILFGVFCCYFIVDIVKDVFYWFYCYCCVYWIVVLNCFFMIRECVFFDFCWDLFLCF